MANAAGPAATTTRFMLGAWPRLLRVTAILLGASLHLASTISVAGTNLRLGLTDLLLPAVLLLVVLERLYSKHTWPALRLPHGWWWLAGLCIWMVVALVTGRIYAGSWQMWGLVNKGFGWFVLVAYFIVGLWLSSHGNAARLSFLRAFFVTGWFASAFSFALFLSALYFVPIDLAANYDRATGFLANPNAFGIAIAAQLVLQLPFMQRREVFPTWLHAAGMAFGLLALLYSGSRSAWLGLAVAVIALIIIQRLPWRGFLAAVSIAIGINALSIDLPRFVPHAMALLPLTSSESSFQTLQPYRYVARAKMMADSASQHRIQSTRLAIEYWRDQPIRGIGLGGFLWRRAQTDDPASGTGIHATGLWLLTETGLVGLLLFSAFFLATLRALIWPRGRLEVDPWPIGVAAVLITLAAASIGTEILYQRYLWVLGGIGLTIAASPLARGWPTDKRTPQID